MGETEGHAERAGVEPGRSTAITGAEGGGLPAAGAASVSSARSSPLLPGDPPSLSPPLTARDTGSRLRQGQDDPSFTDTLGTWSSSS